jgi:hypothetical protein
MLIVDERDSSSAEVAPVFGEDSNNATTTREKEAIECAMVDVDDHSNCGNLSWWRHVLANHTCSNESMF